MEKPEKPKDNHYEVVGNASIKIIKAFEILDSRGKLVRAPILRSFIHGMRKMVTGDSDFRMQEREDFLLTIVPKIERLLDQDTLRMDIQMLLTYALSLVNMAKEGSYDTSVISHWVIPDFVINQEQLGIKIKTLMDISRRGINIDNYNLCLSLCDEVGAFYEKHPDWKDSNAYDFFHAMLHRLVSFADTISEEQLLLAAEARDIAKNLRAGRKETAGILDRLDTPSKVVIQESTEG